MHLRWRYLLGFVFWLTYGVGHRDCLAQVSLQDLRDIRSEIELVLGATNVPGAGVSIVTRDTSILIAGFGKADLASNTSADENTLFRVASVSKMFAALSILKLQEQGLLRLEDKIRDHAPDVIFTNPWENTHPVRIVHLLEHTTGWDDYHLAEQTDVPLPLKQGLDLHTDSRTCRWIPGSRMAYSNSGAAVAAYIVEKVTGKLYEDYVSENFLEPLGMYNTTFVPDERVKRLGATLYDDALQPLPYFHVIHRPAGAMHSSAKDMSRFLTFLLNGGSCDSLQVLSPQSIRRMEASKSTPGAAAGLELGYGLANAATEYKGFVYQGHNGMMAGALAEFAYLPDHGVGHAFFINSGNASAFSRLSEIIRNFEIKNLPPAAAARRPPVTDFTFRNGYYFPINPRNQMGFFFDRIFDIYVFEKEDTVLTQSWIFPGAKTRFYPTAGGFCNPPGARTSLVVAEDPLEGEVLHTGSRVYKYVPAWIVFGQLAIAGSWLFMMGLGSIVWVFALASRWSGRSRTALRVASYPMATTVMFTAMVLGWLLSLRFFNHGLAAPGLLSVSLLIISVSFIAASLVSPIRIFLLRRSDAGRFTLWSMMILALLHFIAAVYLVAFDVIPLITWA